jgi:hypothetical protein
MEENQNKHKAKMSFKQSSFGFLRGYYLLTPAFLVLELLWRVSFRVPFLLAVPLLRYLYYGFCFGCGTVCYFRPKATPVVALTESTTNIALVFAGYFIAYYNAIFVIGETGNIPEILTIKGTLSFAVPATVCVAGFYHCQRTVNRTLKEKIKF